jgi:hypothetical protein
MMVLGASTAAAAKPAAAHAPSAIAAKRSAHRPTTPPPPELTATVSRTGGVALLDARGHRVSRLEPGWYTVAITVDARDADFHLVGPGTNRSTPKHFRGDVLWGVHFVRGTFRYLDDAKAKSTTQTVSVS